MKQEIKYKALFASLALSALLPLSAFASGGTDGGGGDICENQIQIIKSDIASWISKNGHAQLQGAGANYASLMLEQISKVKAKCVGPGDKGYPVEMDGTAKTCRFDKKGSKRSITCDIGKFNYLKEDDQYVLVHHELAGLAGLESPQGDVSAYTLSNQITGFLESQIVRRLVVRPSNPQEPDWQIYSKEASEHVLSRLASALENADFVDCTVNAQDYANKTIRRYNIVTTGAVKKGFYNQDFSHTDRYLLKQSEIGPVYVSTNLQRNKKTGVLRYYQENNWYMEEIPNSFQKTTAIMDFELDPSGLKIKRVVMKVLPAYYKASVGTISEPSDVILQYNMDKYNLNCNAR